MKQDEQRRQLAELRNVAGRAKKEESRKGEGRGGGGWQTKPRLHMTRLRDAAKKPRPCSKYTKLHCFFTQTSILSHESMRSAARRCASQTSPRVRALQRRALLCRHVSAATNTIRPHLGKLSDSL